MSYELGLQCPYCKKAVMYLYKIPNFNKPLRSEDAFTKADVKIINDKPMQCQWCDAMISLIYLQRKRIKYFDYESGELMRKKKKRKEA